MPNVIEYLSRQPKSRLIALGFVIVILVGIFDYLTGPQLFVSIFYFIPIILVTWFTERWAGIMVSIASGITWRIADFTSGAIYSNPVIPYWNMSVRTATFLIVTFLLSSLKIALEHEEEIARRDSLTGAANERYFMELADLEISKTRRDKHPFTVVYIDVDNLREVNDLFGRSIGDALLCSVVNTVQNNIRSRDVVARLGGDEFALLLPETGLEAAKVISSKIEDVNLGVMRKNGWPATLSMGVVTFLSPPSTVDEMLNKSEGLAHAAKNSGKNTIKYEVFGTGEKGFQ